MADTTTVKAKKVYECKINPQLLAVWHKMKRKNDAQKIADRFGWSRAPIDKALNFGYVVTDEIVLQINTYFKERLQAEGCQADDLLLESEKVETKKTGKK